MLYDGHRKFVGVTLGERIAQAREMAGLSPVELARSIGLSRASVSQWEADATKNLKINNLFEVARVTGADIYWLALETPPPPHYKAMMQFARLPPELQKPLVEQIAALNEYARMPDKRRSA